MAENVSSKLLVLCQVFYPELISTGQTLTELCEELVKMGVDVEVVCGPLTYGDRKTYVPKHIEYKGIRIKRVWGTRYPKLHLAGRILNQLTYATSVFLELLLDSSRRPVLVLTNPPFLSFICAFLKILRYKKPYIYLIFDVYPDTAVNLGLLKERSVLVTLWNRINQFVFKQAEEIIVIGRCMQEVISKKVPPESRHKIRKIHVWSDDRHIWPVLKNENSFVAKWGLTGKFVLGYFGNMGRFHDVETMMYAAEILRKQEEIVFLFVGEGHKKLWMERFAGERRLTNCQFHSYVDRSDLGVSLSCADIGLVSLALGQEGLSVPSKTFGVMAAGVPVIMIGSSFSEISRIVTEEECGIAIQPGDVEGLVKGILDLYRDRERLGLMGQNGRRAIEMKYSLAMAVKGYYEIITSLNTH